ncbi:MAG: DUF3431 domain-containing protein [Runella slithyformis]|nr:MAG: DUF3431 domain-containing protein [Runella slithyformis]TAE98529.1 MAG: DUF3431 domain-containing protein [Runella slithyformis]TAF24561.1 MAG: DUF3431 domain-containing protein [Runella slithyformis]TAF49471.1 MAG: DUF3431 domain-containing protein [Runella slithyformis]TAF79305.1 MAG: DUF3431 domain-containing protein [Runella slithyformis]
MLELVVAHYTEDLSWLRTLPRNIRQTVYSKNHEILPPNSQLLPNVGREAHTYLTHFVSHYHALSEWTICCQGKPFDHAYDFKKWLKSVAAGHTVPQPFDWRGHIVDTDDQQGGLLFKNWSKNEDGRGLDLDQFHTALFGTPGPAFYTFVLGAQFAVHRSVVHERPLAFYERALAISIDFVDAAHCYERNWNRVFGVDFALPNGQRTAYLKPIKAQL